LDKEGKFLFGESLNGIDNEKTVEKMDCILSNQILK